LRSKEEKEVRSFFVAPPTKDGMTRDEATCLHLRNLRFNPKLPNHLTNILA
jgi:hypothetical protein